MHNVRDWLLGTVRSTLLILASTAVGVSVVTACNDTTAPRPSVSVSVLTQSKPSYAADSTGRQTILCEVTLQAHNGGQDAAGWMDATVTFYAVNDSRTPLGVDTIPADVIRSSWGAESIAVGQNHDETAIWDLSADIPFTLKIRFGYGWAKGSVAFSEVPLSCKPPTPAGPPPTIAILQDQVDTAPEPSDILHVSYTAGSAVGLWQSFMEATGPCDVTVAIPESLQLAATHDVGLRLPAACTLGVPVRVTATAIDLALQQTSHSITLPALVDHKAPSLAGSINTPYTDFGFVGLASFTGYVFTGDTISVFVRAADNHAVHEVYWEVLPAGLRDSLRGNDSADFIDTVRIATQASWTGTIQVRSWTRDGSGNVSDTIATQPGAIQVFPTVGPSPTLTSIPGRISDVAFDEKRGVLYLLQSRSISVFSPTSLSIVRTIALPDSLPGFDLTPSGDSIVTVLANSRALGIVDLTQASPALHIVPLALDSSVTRLLDIRVARTGLAVITAENAPVGVDRTYTYDLVSGTLRLRSDAPTLGQNSRGLLERSTDGNVLVANGFAASFVRYDAPTDAFGPALSAQVDNAQPALDSTGAHVAVFGGLYDSSLQYLFTIEAAHRGPGLSAFSPNGQTHYMAIAPAYVGGIWVSPGIVRSQVSDGSIIDRIPVVMLTTLVRVSPDGSTLAAVEGYTPGSSHIAVINLSQLH